MKKSYQKILAGILIALIALMISVSKNVAKVLADNEIIPPEGNFIVSLKNTTIVPGVTETEFIYNKPDGSNPVSGFIVDVHLGSSVNIMAASTNYNETGTQIVREMARAAQIKTGRNIVAAFNADLNWLGTGESTGPLIVDGKVLSDKPDVFFGILKNGEAIIGDGNKFRQVKDDLVQAVRGMGWLIRDNKVVVSSTDLAPRTAVGIKADGTVFFFVAEGRMYPRSVGISLKDMAEMMHAYGAVVALNLDGGGSTTYLAKREGETSLELRNIPSDGTERPSISSLLVYAEPGDGVFHHAAITTDGDVYTPYSEVQFAARGVDSAGGAAPLPDNLIWKLADEKYGTIDENGKFISNGTEGKVNVYLQDANGRKVGEGSVEIRTPDEINFRSDEFSLGFNETTDFGIRVTYQKRIVNIKDGDIIWEYDERLGVFENNIFTSNPDESVSGTIKATIANTNISKEIYVVVGKLPLVIFDFENDAINAKWEPSGVNGGEADISIVHRDSGEPVRFGNQALRIDFDYTNVPPNKNPSGAYAGFTDKEGLEELGVTFQLPGSPVGIGMWVYGTEEAQGLWLRTGIGVNGTTAWKAFDLTTEQEGINWLGWKYVEVNLTDFGGPYTILPGQFIRLMITAASFNRQPLRPVGNIYVDNITVTYGTNPQDYQAPEIDYIKINDQIIENEQVVYTNNFTVETSFREFEDKYASGIDYDNVNIYVDGVNYKDKEGYALNITEGKAYLQNIHLIDGVHEIKVVVIDNAGNEATLSRYITVDTGANNKVYLESKDEVIIGKDYIIELKADDIDNINGASISLSLSKNLTNFDIEFSEAFAGNYEYLSGIRMLNITANRINNSDVDCILKIKIHVDSKLNENAVVNYKFNRGEFDYIQDPSGGLYLKSFSALPKNLKVAGALKITSNVILLGHDGIFTVTDADGNPVENAEIFSITSGTRHSLGKTDQNGVLITRAFSDSVVSFTVVAQLNDEVSFEFKGQSYDSVGDINGTPYIVSVNSVQNPESSKNITWISNALASNKKALVQYALKSDYELLGEEAFAEKEGNNSIYVFSGSANIHDNYAVYINNVVINGLLSGKEYLYRVGNGEYWSEIGTFKTGYKNSDVNILILGDIQTADFGGLSEDLRKISMDGNNYDVVIQLGDLVDNADVFSNWSEILNVISGSFMGDLDIVHVLGNHEYQGDVTGDIAKGMFNIPKDKNYYSVEYGNVYVAVINYGISANEFEEAKRWIVEDASKSKAKWRILVTHQPPYYTNPQSKNDLYTRNIPQLAELAGIDFVFAANDHAYARTYPVINGQRDNNGVVYFVSGALGEKRYPAVNNPEFNFEIVADDFDDLYISIEAKETTFKITAYQTDGTVIDEYIKIKANDHNHEYSITEDRLVCGICHYNRPIGNYTGFVKTLNNNIMYLVNGEPYKNGLLVLGDDKYYFDEETGYAYTGTRVIWGLETTFDEHGRYVSGGTGFVQQGNHILYYNKLLLHKGWLELDGATYYFSNVTGYMSTGITLIDGKLYEFGKDGKLIRRVEPGFIVTEGGTIYVNERGVQLFGWQVIDGYTYYFSTANGYMRTGRTYINGQLYDFDENGRLIGKVQTGFITTPEGTIYVNENGVQLFGWQVIDGYTYYFSTANGYMRTGRTYINGELYDFDENGRLIGKVQTGFITTPEGTIYINENGVQLFGWQVIDGYTYYFSTANGYMRTGRTYINGQLYDFDENGRLIGKVQTGFITTPEGTIYINENGVQLFGWQVIDGYTYYFSTANGYMRTGRTYINGELYDFDENGRLIGKVQTGFIHTPEGTIYINRNGVQLYGWQVIDGYTYYFSTANGYMRTGRTIIDGVLYDFTEDGKLIGKVETEVPVEENPDTEVPEGEEAVENPETQAPEGGGAAENPDTENPEAETPESEVPEEGHNGENEDEEPEAKEPEKENSETGNSEEASPETGNTEDGDSDTENPAEENTEAEKPAEENTEEENDGMENPAEDNTEIENPQKTALKQKIPNR